MAIGAPYNPDNDFRLLFDEIEKRYYIQVKRSLFGWRFLDYSFVELQTARDKLKKLREEHRLYRVKKKYIVLKE